jgi:hypothetical protein
MKALIAFAVVLALGAAAQAKPAPSDRVAMAAITDESPFSIGAAGAMLERDYFNAPPPVSARRIYPCRLQLRVFEKTRLAQSCN